MHPASTSDHSFDAIHNPDLVDSPCTLLPTPSTLNFWSLSANTLAIPPQRCPCQCVSFPPAAAQCGPSTTLTPVLISTAPAPIYSIIRHTQSSPIANELACPERCTSTLEQEVRRPSVPETNLLHLQHFRTNPHHLRPTHSLTVEKRLVPAGCQSDPGLQYTNLINYRGSNTNIALQS